MQIGYVKAGILDCFLKVACQNEKILSVTFSLKKEHFKVTSPNLLLCLNELELYFKKELTIFTTQIELSGTSFQKEVYKELLKIPYSKTTTYSDIATNLGRPKAYRAVANALAKNPIPIIIPCHRVVAKDSLGGYSTKSTLDGAFVKRALLGLEGLKV